jgi:zinc protease
MFVISGLHRYRFPLLLFIFSFIAVFLLRPIVSGSQKLLHVKGEHYQQIFVDNKTTNFTVTQNVQKTVLENGLTVLTKEVHNAPVVTVQLWYDIGSTNEADGINGIAHQLEHIMFKGTKSRPVQFARLFSALGSDSNGFTSYEQTAYYHTAERDKLKALLELEADRMENLLIDNQQLNSEKRVVISELQGYENSAKYRLKRAVMQSVFPDSAYGFPTGGTPEDVEKFTVEQVREYYQTFYNPDNAILVIVGDFQTKETLQTVQEVFGQVPRSKPLPQVSQSPKMTIPNSPVVLRSPGGSKIIQRIYPLPDLHHPDIPVLGVMDYILTAGKKSYLSQNLIKSGLATNISARVVGLSQVGWYDLSVDVSPEKDLNKINASINSAITKLVETGVSREQVERAKKQLIANVVLNKRDITSQGMQFANDQLVAGDYQYTDKYLEKVSQVTSEDIIYVIKKYLKPENSAVGFFEPQVNAQVDNYRPSPVESEEDVTPGVKVSTAELQQYLPKTNTGSDFITKPSIAPQKITFDNGLQVLLLPDHSSPTVTLGGYIKAGKEFEEANKAGLASLVANSLLSGTKTKDSLTISENIEARGASLNLTTLREGVQIESKSLREDFPVVLETLADVVRNSTFPEKELEVSRQRALNALKSDLHDPYEVANRKFIQSLYPQNHPLHIFPTKRSIQNVQRQDLIEFREKHYRPDRMVLAVVGDFDVDKMRSLMESKFADWRVHGQAPMVKYPQVIVTDHGSQFNSVLPGNSQAVTYMGYVGIKRQDPRFYQALVLNQILGGDSLSSRLGSEVRDRLGLTYHIYSNFQGGKNVGTFLIEMQTNPEDTNRAIATTRKLLAQIHQQGVTESELETAKRTLISQYNLSLSKPEELVTKLLLNEFYDLQDFNLSGFADKIEQVTKKEVDQVARQLLDPDKFIVVTAGPGIVAHNYVR